MPRRSFSQRRAESRGFREKTAQLRDERFFRRLHLESQQQHLQRHQPVLRLFSTILQNVDVLDPVNKFVILDEHPDSINDGYFLNNPDNTRWVDLPASYHNGAVGLSFADGHSEIHRWIGGRTQLPVSTAGFSAPLINGRGGPELEDFRWLMERTAVKRPN